MKLRKILLGTTAALGAGLITGGAPSIAGAAEVRAGGYPDLTITGFARFRAHGGQIDDARINNAFSRDLDFSNDTEVHVVARAKDERTGIEYGGTIEFEADTNRTDNTDETWLFVSGAFGEVRLGDEDGASDNSAVGAHTLAAGTGGLDGDVIDTFAGGPAFKLDNTDDARSKTLAWRNSWDIPAMSRTTQAAVLEKDASKRKATYEAVQREHQKTSPFVIMFQQIEVAVSRSKVGGFVIGPSFDNNYYSEIAKK